MKHNNVLKHFYINKSGFKELLKVMRISTLLLFTFSLHLQATNSYGQEALVTLKSNSVSLRQLINEIEKQTDYLVIYSNHEVKTSKKVIVTNKSDKVSTFLKEMFEDSSIDYDFENNYIILHKKKELPNVNENAADSSRQQKKTINGVVYDDNDEVLPGAYILVKDTSVGTVSDINGEFSLVLPDGAKTILVTFLGMKTQEIDIENNQFFNIRLEQEGVGLDEIVIIGYGNIKKSDATGAVTLLKPEEFNRAKYTNATDMLLGKVAGLHITQGSGSPGALGTVRIRQGASLNASNEPLIVIDGLTEANLASINPNDIESINVLKDASASAIYGARGANGVIIITTKKGPSAAKGKIIRPQIEYRSELFYNTAYQLLDVYGVDEFKREYEKRGWDTGLLGNANTDWQREVTKTSFSKSHTITATGTLPYTPYRISFGHNDEQAIVRSDKQKHTTITTSFSPKLLDDHLNIDASLRYSYRRSPEKGGSIASAAFTDPSQPIFADYGPVTVNGVTYDQKAFGYFMYGADEFGNNPQRESNPVAAAMLPGLGFEKNDRLYTSFKVNYKIHGFEDLALNFAFNSNTSKTKSKMHERDNTPTTWSNSRVNLDKGGIGINSFDSNERNRYTLDYYLNYNKDFGNHGIDLTAGHSYEYYKYTTRRGEEIYNDGETVAGSVPLELSGEVALTSYFSRLNYKLFDKYLFTATIRADASSRFAPETRWGYFPSGAFAWKINEEKFLKDVESINDLKFRLSYGVTGQQNINNDYAYQAIYYESTDEYLYKVDDVFYKTYYPSAFDRSLRWERTSTTNLGLDFALFNNRLYGSVDVYKRLTKDMLMHAVVIPAGSNFAETMDQNIGEMSSKGFELALGGSLIQTQDFSWDLNFNFNYNSSKIEKLTAYDDKLENTWIKTGDTGSNRFVQYHKVGETPFSYYLAKQVYENGVPVEKFYDPNNPNEHVLDDSADANKWTTGKSALVPYYGGISTQLKYKSWDFGMNMHYAFGQYVYWQTMQSGSNNSFFSGTSRYPRNTIKGWVPEWEKQHYFSDYWLYKGDFLKIDNVVVGYNFKNLFNDAYSLRISLGVQNLYTFTNYPGIDPEVYTGLDNSDTPRSRMYMLSLTFKL